MDLDRDMSRIDVPEEKMKTNCNKLHVTRNSEDYKLSIKGIASGVKFDQIRKLLLNTLKLKPLKIKPGRGVNFVTFKTSEERDEAIGVLHGFKWRNFELKAHAEKSNPCKRKMDDPPDVSAIKTLKLHSEEEIREMVKDKVIPLWKMDYEDQLNSKSKDMESFFEKMWNEIKHVNPGMKDSIKDSCTREKIHRSPVLDSYRNKCEFSIEYRDRFLVGFTYGTRKEGTLRIGPIHHLPHIPTKMKTAAQHFEDFLNRNGQTVIKETNWKHLTVRTTINGQIMIMPVIQKMSQSSEDIEQLKTILKDEFSNMNDFSIDSFYFQVLSIESPELNLEPYLLFGNAVITEEVLGLNFQISPDAFFQTNVKAAEVLYSTVIQEAEVDENTSVIDVCCGTGTIGISIARKAGEVIGVETIVSAVRNAKENAKLNGLQDKCTFIAGPAEELLNFIVGKAKYERITAIVDPPRAGLQKKGIAALRNCEAIKKLVYVSCDPNLALANIVSLTRPMSKGFRGKRFIPKKFIPLDLFPSTAHVELVLILERD